LPAGSSPNAELGGAGVDVVDAGDQRDRAQDVQGLLRCVYCVCGDGSTAAKIRFVDTPGKKAGAEAPAQYSTARSTTEVSRRGVLENVKMSTSAHSRGCSSPPEALASDRPQNRITDSDVIETTCEKRRENRAVSVVQINRSSIT
jgi:hypothetical protein